MPEGKPKWNADGSDMPPIDPHTQAKHLILEKYIEDLVYTLYAKARCGETNFTFIDGFSGGGLYKDRDQYWDGSPIRIIKAVREGHKKSNRVYQNPLNIKYIFIDSEKNHIDCLKNFSMSQAGLEDLIDEKEHRFNDGYGDRIEQCVFIQGDFEDFLQYCIYRVKSHKGHSFFFLDPFGWTDVSMKTIRTINSLKRTEILYTYMINYIRRFLVERYTRQRRGFQEVLEADGYYEDANLEDDTIGEECYLRDQSVKLFIEKGQSKYIFTFALIPKGENNKNVLYYLMHISQSLTALEVIKECFEHKNTLDYQYYYEIYGYGFKTSNYYNQNQTSLNFNTSQHPDEFCISKLEGDVGRLIFTNPDGILFQDIRQLTMPLNPATRRLYNKYVNRYISEKEIEVWRDGKCLKSNNITLRKNDIIKVCSKYQFSLFSKSRFFSNG